MHELSPGLMVIHGNRLEDLRDLAVQWMRRYPLQPLENEVLLVQSNGIAQWLKLALASDQGCGIAAALSVELPARFLWQLYRNVLGREAIPVQSPLDKAPLVWRLMRLLPALLDQPAFAPLRQFLGDDPQLRRRHQLAGRLADLFDQYQVYRADWLADWAAGRDVLRTSRQGERPLVPAEHWQPALWRALLADVGDEQLAGSRAGVHPRFIAALQAATQAPAGLPRRVIIFGISSLPAQLLEALAALARFSQVMLCVHNPCQYHWGDIVEDRDLLRHNYRRQSRRAEQARQGDLFVEASHGQPLLAAWGKQGRDYINLLDQYDQPEHYRAHFERIDLFEAPPAGSLLGQLHSDILELRPLAESRRHWPPVDPQHDDSLRFHIAHSAQREVEILHDQLLASFSADPTLRPRDVIVMLPDINSHAASIQAVFGQFRRDDPRFIPFTLADQGVRGHEPLLIAVEQLLRLPDSRLGVSEVLDLLEVAALRRRFAIDDSQLPLLRRWLEGAGVRWGLDAGQRADLGVGPGLQQNTWQFGLHRMLLGYAAGAAPAWQGIEPYDESAGLEAALLGPLSCLLDAMQLQLQLLRQPAVPEVWGERLRALLERFLLAETEHDQQLLGQLLDALEHWLALCEAAGLSEALPLQVVAEAWLGGLDQGRLSQRFLAGAVNFCTLMPMRAIPFRQVCLLGMNDGDYPRSPTPVDFDLMAGDYRPGDRSRREDDRYLLLEALLAARQRLYISWVGRSIRDNSERPPSVLIGQLRDHLASGWQQAGGGELLAALTCEHPLQPFSPRYFQADSGLFSYAREWAAVHAAGAQVEAAPPLADWPEAAGLSPEQLWQFLRDPVKCFFNGRLKVHLDQAEQLNDDQEPFDLDALQNHALKGRLLQAGLHGQLQAEAERLQRAGHLPLAGFGERCQTQLLAGLPEQLQRYADLLALWPQRLESPLAIDLQCAGVQLRGWLGDLHGNAAGERARIELFTGGLRHKQSGYRWHRMIRPLVWHVLAAASGQPVSSWLAAEDETLQLAALSTEAALAILDDWLQGWLQGMRSPLPVAPKTALAWLSKGEQAACETYQGQMRQRGECQDSASLARQFADFAALSADGRFAEWSERLYRPLQQCLATRENTQ